MCVCVSSFFLIAAVNIGNLQFITFGQLSRKAHRRATEVLVPSPQERAAQTRVKVEKTFLCVQDALDDATTTVSRRLQNVHLQSSAGGTRYVRNGIRSKKHLGGLGAGSPDLSDALFVLAIVRKLFVDFVFPFKDTFEVVFGPPQGARVFARGLALHVMDASLDAILVVQFKANRSLAIAAAAASIGRAALILARTASC